MNIDFLLTSPRDEDYNCIAWAVADNERWWWPHRTNFWPTSYPAYLDEQPEPLPDFPISLAVEALEFVGFVRCDSSAPEDGFEKVMLYAINGMFRHAIKQRPNGVWTSKMGWLEDIEHPNHDDLAGDLYGDVVEGLILKRTLHDDPGMKEHAEEKGGRVQ